MPSNSIQSTPFAAARAGKDQKFNPHDPTMGMLLRGLLHELRNPLSSILTAASLLHDSPLPGAPELDEESRMLLEVVKKESQRLNHILTEFAGYIKLPAPQPHTFNLSHTARSVIHELQVKGVLPSAIKVHDELPESCPVWADESQIRAALRHILSNAGEAMPDGGELWISRAPAEAPDEAGETVVFRIADSGKGFTSESRDRAFQPFYSDKNHSLGLGLSSTRSLIEAAAGQVWLEDNLDGQTPPSPTPNHAAAAPTRICFELPRTTSS